MLNKMDNQAPDTIHVKDILVNIFGAIAVLVIHLKVPVQNVSEKKRKACNLENRFCRPGGKALDKSY